MTRFVARRLIGLMVTVFITVTLVFFALQLVPGDPVEAALSQSTATQDVLDRRRAALGLDLPLPVQYVRFLSRLPQADLGVSWSAGQPVTFLIGQQLGSTVSLASGAMLIAVVLGGLLGVFIASQGDTWPAVWGRAFAIFFLALPVMFTATFAIWLMSVRLALLPATGRGSLAHLILPSLVLGVSVSGSVARIGDAGVSDAIRQLFMRTAVAKGLNRQQALLRHALRVGLLPALDVIALQFGYLLGGTVVIESVFARPGVGRLLLTAVLDKDLPVVQGLVILTAVSYSLLNLLADITHGLLDPRIRLES